MRRTMLTGLVLAAALAAWAADRVTYLNDDPADRDVVTITSDAPLEYMVTRTQEVKGTVQFDPANILNQPEASFEIPVDRLETGIPLRDEHLRGEAWLNARQFPLVKFTLKQIKTPIRATPLPLGGSLRLDVIGTVEIKGVAVDLPARIDVTRLAPTEETAARLPGEILRVAAEFDILLSDFGVDIPAMATLKVANRQHVEVNLLASTERMVPPQR